MFMLEGGIVALTEGRKGLSDWKTEFVYTPMSVG
jgi:hypothetical protein